MLIIRSKKELKLGDSNVVSDGSVDGIVHADGVWSGDGGTNFSELQTHPNLHSPV